MISKLIAKVRQFEFRVATSHDLQGDHLALTQLLKMFPEQVFLPLTSWSISPREVLHICNDIFINKRKNIVEFGSGFSTICVAQLLKINNIKASFVSVENDEVWANDLRNLLERLKLQDFVTIKTAPISDITEEFAKDSQQKWYDVDVLNEAFDSIDAVDLVIVDGPFGGTTKYARFSAVPYLKSKLSENYAIFLDDSGRVEEKEIANDWKNILNAQVKDYTRYILLTNLAAFDVSSYSLRYTV